MREFIHDTWSSAHNGIQDNPLIRDHEIPLADFGLEYISPDPAFHMPIRGLYQTGGTTAPGGSVAGQPGRNAAMVMLKDLGTSLEEVVGKKDGKLS